MNTRTLEFIRRLEATEGCVSKVRLAVRMFDDLVTEQAGRRSGHCIYIAGPYRAATDAEVQANIQRAQQVGALVAELGWYPVVPHSLSAGIEHVGDDAYWLAHTMAVMERCDAVLVCPNYLSSAGTLAEIERAEAMGLPVYYDAGEVPEVAKNRSVSRAY